MFTLDQLNPNPRILLVVTKQTLSSFCLTLCSTLSGHSFKPFFLSFDSAFMGKVNVSFVFLPNLLRPKSATSAFNRQCCKNTTYKLAFLVITRIVYEDWSYPIHPLLFVLVIAFIRYSHTFGKDHCHHHDPPTATNLQMGSGLFLNRLKLLDAV
jgi:hypothetical protein